MRNKCYSRGFFQFHFPSVRIADVNNYMPTAIDVAAVSSWSLPRKTHRYTYKHTKTYAHKNINTHTVTIVVYLGPTLSHIYYSISCSRALTDFQLTATQHNFSAQAAQSKDITNT